MEFHFLWGRLLTCGRLAIAAPTLELTGQPFWQDEMNRLVRNQTELERIAHYVEMNPVKAAPAAMPEEFAWSSARPIDNRPPVANRPHTGGHGVPDKSLLEM